MSKTFYYLVGLPRAGNTLFASIINQNPDIAVTANSPLGDIMRIINEIKKTSIVQSFPDLKSFDNMIKGIIPNYYKDWKQNYIIDRHSWGRIDMINILNQYKSNELKFIVLVRPIEEVLASLIKIGQATENNYIKNMGNTLEQQCREIMRDNGMVDLELRAIYNLLRNENKNHVCLIEYDELVKEPKKEIDKVYDFLGIERFNHSFFELKQLSNNNIQYDDTIYGTDLHKIKTDKIEKSNYKLTDYITPEMIERCQQSNFWKHS